MVTQGATALDMNSYSNQEMQVTTDSQMNNRQVIHEHAQNEITPQENQPEHSEMNMGEGFSF